MSEQEETQNAGAVSPALPDGIGLTLDDVRALLAKEHETIVPKDDPMLMIVTLLNAYLGEVDKLHARHGKALAAHMAGKTDAYVKGVQGATDAGFRETLAYNCGPLFMDALKNPEVIEIMLNPDGMLWIERYGQDQEPIGTMEPVRSRAVLSLVASALDLTVNDHSPIIEGEFPLDGSRFEATFPPIVSAPSFSLRKKASKVMSVEDYVADGVITPAVVPFLEHAVVTRKNIMVVGGTSSGKTTFVNAIIQRIALLCPSHRLLILEDTAELQSQSPNTVFFRTSPLAGVDMRTLAKVAMRYAPRRILIGEVRDSAALELLKLWNTGHPGGVGTFHADSAEEALPRLEELVEEAGLGSKQKLIGRGVDVIVFMEKTPDNRRRLSQIIKVHGFNPKTEQYETSNVYTVSAA